MIYFKNDHLHVVVSGYGLSICEGKSVSVLLVNLSITNSVQVKQQLAYDNTIIRYGLKWKCFYVFIYSDLLFSVLLEVTRNVQ